MSGIIKLELRKRMLPIKYDNFSVSKQSLQTYLDLLLIFDIPNNRQIGIHFRVNLTHFLTLNNSSNI